MDYWSELPPVRQLPAEYRLWAWWLRNGPRRAQGTVAGSALFRLLRAARRTVRSRADPYVTLHAPPRPAVTIHLYDFESFHHALPVWYRGDAEATIVQRLIEPGTTYIDAGANFGVYALYAAQIPGAKVCAIEPQPHLVEAMSRSVAANRLHNMIIIEAALAEKNGSAELFVDAGGSGSASICAHVNASATQRVHVRTATLDSIVADHQLAPVGLLKMDLENAEWLALQGARELLSRDAPFVIFEAGSRQPQHEVFALLTDAGYHSFHDQASLHERKLVPPRLEDPLTNIVAIPRGRDAARLLGD